MTLSDRDFSQMDTDYLDDLPEDQLRALSKQLLTDLKAAREQLKQTPGTSSRPPSLRKTTLGSRTPQGSPVIDTVRLRQLNLWDFIAQVLASRRKSQPPLCLPTPVLA